MKIILDSDITNLELPFTPTSVYLNGIQTYAYSIQQDILFFNNIVSAGTEIILIPASAIRVLDDAVVTIDIAEIGYHSIISDPFGACLFSLDTVTWVKALSHIFPATIYMRPVPDDPVLDYTCIADQEVVIWRGTDYTRINEDGLVEVFEELPFNCFVGGLKYRVI